MWNNGEYRFKGSVIPKHMMEKIREYIFEHHPVGHFLTAVICNDLKDAVGKADDENLPNLAAYVGFFYNEAPGTCWGSKEKMDQWLASPPTGRERLETEDTGMKSSSDEGVHLRGFDHDVSLADLALGCAGPLKQVINAIYREWIGVERSRISDTRCGTMVVEPTGNEGNARIVINLRFPLPLEPLWNSGDAVVAIGAHELPKECMDDPEAFAMGGMVDMKKHEESLSEHCGDCFDYDGVKCTVPQPGDCRSVWYPGSRPCKRGIRRV